MSPLRWVRRWGVGAVVLATAGCGGGGGGGEATDVLRIATTNLLVVQPGLPYTEALSASGGAPPYRFRLAAASPSLPAGLALSESGALSGTTTVVGTTFLGVEVVDAAVPPAVATRTLALQVGGFDVHVGGLLAGDAWTGGAHTVWASPTGGSVDIRLETTSLGSALSDVEPSAGTAIYEAGTVAGTDVLRFTRSNGLATRLPVVVRQSPVSRMTARFGTSDVWHVAFEGKEDSSHAFATDFHDALATAGLRDPLSTDEVGGPSDELASILVRSRTLRELNAMFLNDPDGDAAPDGLAVSFPWEPPDPTFLPPPGAWDSFPGAWNQMTVHAGNTFTYYGYSIQDQPDNRSVENLATAVPGSPIGVFCDLLVLMFNSTYGNWTLPAAPVTAEDVPILKGLLYGPPQTGPRAAEIERAAAGFARTLAFAIAHETGHALGLVHVQASGSIMDPTSISLPPGSTFSWDAAQLLQLRSALPGPGR